MPCSLQFRWSPDDSTTDSHTCSDVRRLAAAGRGTGAAIRAQVIEACPKGRLLRARTARLPCGQRGFRRCQDDRQCATRGGNPKSAVRVLIYEDLQCPDCSDFRKALDESVLPRYGASVAFEHRDFPLPKHTWAKEAAIAARYFQALDPKLAADFRRTVQGNLGKVNAEGFRTSLIEFCRDRQLDTDKALAALSYSTYAQAVEADFQAGVAAGIRRTPTVIVGGKSFVETIDIGALQRSLDALLGGTSGSQ